MKRVWDADELVEHWMLMPEQPHGAAPPRCVAPYRIDHGGRHGA